MWNSLWQSLTWQDLLALGWFWMCWFGYTWLAEKGVTGSRSLIGVTHRYREAWAREMPTRDMPVTDASLVGNLMGSVSFYASTTIYIIAGLLALVGTVDKISSFAADLPFAQQSSREMLELKLLVLIVIFVAAYFKFTWALRQFNFLCILIGGMPHERNLEKPRWNKMSQRIARINSFAGDEFNRGIRAYYFGIAALAWFIQPWLFWVATTGVVWILYQRDFRSATLAVLAEDMPDPL